MFVYSLGKEHYVATFLSMGIATIILMVSAACILPGTPGLFVTGASIICYPLMIYLWLQNRKSSFRSVALEIYSSNFD
jgi:hypothetical protein